MALPLILLDHKPIDYALQMGPFHVRELGGKATHLESMVDPRERVLKKMVFWRRGLWGKVFLGKGFFGQKFF